MNLDHIRLVFIDEARELLVQMEQLILGIERGEADADAVHALFRCAHTIKGSAGMFALEPVVGFTHVVENLLDQIRKQLQPLDRGRSALLLACRDHLASLIERFASGESDGHDALSQKTADTLLAQLRTYLDPAAAPKPVPSSVDVGPTARTLPAAGPARNWHVSLGFHPNAFRRGIHPPSFVAGLRRLAPSVQVDTQIDATMDAHHADPALCFLAIEVDLPPQCTRAAIDDVLEFLEGDCTIHVLGPDATDDNYRQFLTALRPPRRQQAQQALLRHQTLRPQELERIMGATEGDGAPGGQVAVTRAPAPTVPDLPLLGDRRGGERRTAAVQALKIPPERLDQLINLVGELVIAQSAMQTLISTGRSSHSGEQASIVQALVEDIRDAALRLRMVPVGTIFSRYQRPVRDMARDLGKDIELTVSGGDTELDKSMVEQLGDPLLHLIRNAIDHGLELPEVRVRHGKPPQGRLALNAFHDSGSVVIEVSDDGAGLDAERIRRKAIERGLISAEQILDETDLFRLILAPGFSTAETVTNLSGRGVGMDVVKRNIESMRGTIDIASVPGTGTRMRLRLPLTLAIIDGFLVELGNAHYVIPLDMLVECLDLSAEDQRNLDQQGFINVRGSALTVLHLRELFGIEARRSARECVVVLQYGGQRVGLIVDRLVGQQQVVIKPLEGLFTQLRGIGGSTVLGSGRIAMILDIPSLIQTAAKDHRTAGVRAAVTPGSTNPVRSLTERIVS